MEYNKNNEDKKSNHTSTANGLPADITKEEVEDNFTNSDGSDMLIDAALENENLKKEIKVLQSTIEELQKPKRYQISHLEYQYTEEKKMNRFMRRMIEGLENTIGKITTEVVEAEVKTKSMKHNAEFATYIYTELYEFCAKVQIEGKTIIPDRFPNPPEKGQLFPVCYGDCSKDSN